MSQNAKNSAMEIRKNRSLLQTYKKKYIENIYRELKDHSNGIKCTRNIIYIMDPTDVGIWHGLAFNVPGTEIQNVNQNEFHGGEYIIELVAQDSYPMTPPKFRFLTPNGVYGKDKQPCVSIGHHHASEYPAALGMTGFGDAIVEAMRAYNELKYGISIITSSIIQKQSYAKNSVAYNAMHHANIMKRFHDHIISHNIAILLPDMSIVKDIHTLDEEMRAMKQLSIS